MNDPETTPEPGRNDVAPLNDDHEERVLDDVHQQEHTDDEIFYGGDESDFDREYFDNPDEHEYYDEPESTDYHPHNS